MIGYTESEGQAFWRSRSEGLLHGKGYVCSFYSVLLKGALILKFCKWVIVALSTKKRTPMGVGILRTGLAMLDSGEATGPL